MNVDCFHAFHYLHCFAYHDFYVSIFELHCIVHVSLNVIIVVNLQAFIASMEIYEDLNTFPLH